LNAAELLEQHPQLTLGQIFSALAYDWDHQSEMDVLLAADELETERLLDQVELEGRIGGLGWVWLLEIKISPNTLPRTQMFIDVIHSRQKMLYWPPLGRLEYVR
jgi:hypothetical protein